MRRRWLWLACVSLGTAVALGPANLVGGQGVSGPARGQYDDGLAQRRAARPVPGRAIIELAGEPLAELLGARAAREQVAARRATIRAGQDQLLRAMAGQGLQAKMLHRYEAAFNGIAVELPESAWPAVRALPGVVAVYPETTRTLALDHSAAYVGARAVAAGMGGTGRGVTVAIIDTGVDYHHPDLGGNGPDKPTAFPTARVVGGYDLVGDAYTQCGDPLQPDSDPMDDNGHGTHVAGTVGANATAAGGITGVAPEVTFMAYKVFGADGDTCTSTVVAAIDRAVADGVQIMNLSLGDTAGTETDPDSRAINNAATKAGVVAAIAAGNDGPGYYTVGSPGAARHALTAGAFTDDGFMAEFGRVVGDSQRWTMTHMSTSGTLPAGGITAPYEYVGYGFAEDFAGRDLTGKIALIQRGFFTFGEKARRAQDYGAVAVLIFNNKPGELAGSIDVAWGVTIATYGVADTAGARLLAALNANPQARVFMDDVGEAFPDQQAGFTSMGPTKRFHWLKPDFVAPGVNILATVPYAPYYDSYSGTSMATPHVAGAVAVLKQLHPDWTPFDIKAALANTARILQDSITGETWPIMAQGAGMIRVDRAAATPIRAYSLTGNLPDAPSFSFGRFPAWSGRSASQQGRVLGPAGTRLSYSVEWLGDQPGMELRVWGDPHIARDGTARFSVSLRLQGGVDRPEGVYGGFVWITTGQGERIHLPFTLVLFSAG